MENHFCTLHGCQMEERDDPRGSHRIGQRTFVCLVCEEEGFNTAAGLISSRQEEHYIGD